MEKTITILPQKNTLVWVKRLNGDIYLAKRNGQELSTNEDASRNCHWSGARLNELQIQSESNCGVHFPYQFSDVTVSEWQAIDASQFQPNTDLITTELCVQNERIAELEGGLKDCAWTLQRVLDTTKPDSDWATFTTSIVDIISLFESLINKGNDTSV